MIEILFLPPLATVQDLGRDGFWAQGLGRAGAMDCVSHRLVNLALGNDPNAATLEIPLTPARFRFAQRQGFALAGAACGATLAGRPLPRFFAGIAEAGEVLELGSMQQGARVYLGLAGGIDVPQVLGSRSTQLREGFGGHAGRVLQAGDRLAPCQTTLPPLPKAGLSLHLPDLALPQGAITLRALPAAEEVEFTAEAQNAFWSEPWRISPQSNRQGFRLEGTELIRNNQQELRSHGIMPGIVQVPSGGQPIIQLADSATMGGYPKIATVIEADLWKIGQARPGDQLRFQRCTPAEAATAEAAQEATFASLAAQQSALAAQHQIWS